MFRKDKPIIVWTTTEMADRCETDDWYTENGKHLEWSQNDHCSVLIGYTEKTVKIADPILGDVEYSKTQFEKVLTSRGKKKRLHSLIKILLLPLKLNNKKKTTVYFLS